MNGNINFGGRAIGAEEPTFVVAEVGINHNGDRALAMRLIDAAAAAGADAVKFQTFVAEQFLTRSSPYLSLFQKCQLSREDFAALAAHARRRGIIFFSTPLDEASADLLDDLGVPGFKVASCDVTHVPLLRHIGSKGKPALLSTGTATLAETLTAVNILSKAGASAVGVFHCVSAYPADPGQVNLRSIATLAEVLACPVGFSDHTLGVDVPVAAVALGAAMIEKHFTLDKKMDGPDHQLSADPGEFARMVASIRVVEKARGADQKKPVESSDTIAALRRSLVAAQRIEKGTIITRQMVGAKRPGTGIQTADLDAVIGRRAAADIAADDVLTWDKLA
jgi:N-acetylneuraminate synthase/N,N'-diacetyllegionaminate synthase